MNGESSHPARVFRLECFKSFKLVIILHHDSQGRAILVRKPSYWNLPLVSVSGSKVLYIPGKLAYVTLAASLIDGSPIRATGIKHQRPLLASSSCGTGSIKHSEASRASAAWRTSSTWLGSTTLRQQTVLTGFQDSTTASITWSQTRSPDSSR